MLGFLFKSSSLVLFYSLIRFSLSLFFTSLIFPEDFGMVVLPVIIFGLHELILEGGYQTSIIKHSAGMNAVSEIAVKNRINLLFYSGLFFLFGTYLANFILFESKIPMVLILFYFVNSYFKSFAFYLEGLLISRGKFFIAESISFLITVFTYGILIGLILIFGLKGYIALGLMALLHSLIYFIFL